MTQSNEQAIWMSPQAFDVLKAELDDLVGPKRTEVVERIAAARDEGDLKENGGYHAAKEEQGKQEARIRQLRQLLENAQVGDAPVHADGTVSAGMVVNADVGGDEMTFLLGNREVAGDTDLDVYSEKSPLGSAIIGHKVGEATSYSLPSGKQVSVKILDAKPFTG